VRALLSYYTWREIAEEVSSAAIVVYSYATGGFDR
jgi:hypothetical protein